MRNSDWSSDVCSSDLISERPHRLYRGQALLPQSFAQSSPEGRPPQRLASRQQHPGFHVMGPGELIEHRAARDAMGIVQLCDVGGEGFGIAGDVQAIVEAPGQLAGVRVHAGSRRVAEDAAESLAFEYDAMKATDRAAFGPGW